MLGCSDPGSRKARLSLGKVAPAPEPVLPADLIAPDDRQDSRDQRESPDRIEKTLRKDPTENAETNEPAEPIERIEPDEPIDKIEPDEPIDKIEPDEPIDKIESEAERARTPSSGRMRALSQPPRPGTSHASGWPD